MPDRIHQYEPLWGSWLVDMPLGAGSFGRVYRVRREEFGQVYHSAVKIISVPKDEQDLRQLLSEGYDETSAKSYYQEVVSDIQQEIRLMSQFRGNSHIVSFEDHHIAERKDGIGWDILIRMELLTGLAEWLQGHSMTRQDVITLGIHICRALELCAKTRTIHRDIKPDNIFVSPFGDYKLGDFGVARQMERTLAGLSKKGTYTYMAPEVYRGEEYGPTVDLYSLGLVMYRLLNRNSLPFYPPLPQVATPRDREEALTRRMKGETLPPVSDIDASLNAVVLKACAFDRRKRWRDAAEMRKALEEALQNKGLLTGRGKPAVVWQAGNTEKSGQPMGSRDRTAMTEAAPRHGHTGKKGGLIPLIAALSVLTLGIITAGVLWLARPPGETPETPPAADSSEPTLAQEHPVLTAFTPEETLAAIPAGGNILESGASPETPLGGGVQNWDVTEDYGFASVLEEYRHAVLNPKCQYDDYYSYDWDPLDWGSVPLEKLPSPNSFGYAYHDLNGDQRPEMILLSEDYKAYAIFSLTNESIEKWFGPYGWYMDLYTMCYINTDDTIRIVYGGGEVGWHEIARLSDAGDRLICHYLIGYSRIATSYENETIYDYSNVRIIDGIISGTDAVISREEYQQFVAASIIDDWGNDDWGEDNGGIIYFQAGVDGETSFISKVEYENSTHTLGYTDDGLHRSILTFIPLFDEQTAAGVPAALPPDPGPGPQTLSRPSISDLPNRPKNQRYSLYTGPGTQYYQVKGKTQGVYVSSNGWIMPWARDGDWLLVEYEVNSGGNRMGYVQGGQIKKFYDYTRDVPELPKDNIPIRMIMDCPITDDPNRSGRALEVVPADTRGMLLCLYGEWAYVEITVAGKPMRGFMDPGGYQYD